MAIRCGVSVAEYADMTPHELMLIVEGHNAHRQQDREDMITQAYLTAVWYRAKKIPKLENVLKKIRPKEPVKPQTPEQMLAIAKQWQARIEKGGG